MPEGMWDRDWGSVPDLTRTAKGYPVGEPDPASGRTLMTYRVFFKMMPAMMRP
jgi:hypothetical protein